jgi:hypothetical protein
MRRPGRAGYHPDVAHTYPPLNVEVRTPRLTLAGASDELLERLVPLVRAGIADAEPWPFDDPISFYAESPEREWQWLRGIWAGRGRVSPDSWRLYFAVLVDGEPVGMQDRGLGYEPNGTDWDTRRGEPARIQQWRLTRDAWERVRRDDIKLTGVEECLPVLGIG